MQHFLRRISALTAVFLLVAAVSSAQTAEVPLEDIPLLEDGSVLQDSFDEDVTARLYAFQGSAGDVVSVAMVQLDEEGDLDPYLMLFDSAGELLAADDDSGSTFLSALIENVELQGDGTYFVLATSLFYLDSTEPDVPEPQEYAVGIQGATPPNSDDFATLELFALEYGDAVRGESTSQAPGIFFGFAANAGDTVSIIMQSDEFPTLLHLFDASGERIAVDASAISDLTLEDSGVYIILATDAFFYESLDEDGFFAGGEFTLSLDGERSVRQVVGERPHRDAPTVVVSPGRLHFTGSQQIAPVQPQRRKPPHV